MPIDRCYCRDIPFTELLARARREGLDAEGVCERSGAGGNCGLCRAYVRVVVATGRTSLPILNDREIEALCRDAGSTGAPASAERAPADPSSGSMCPTGRAGRGAG